MTTPQTTPQQSPARRRRTLLVAGGVVVALLVGALTAVVVWRSGDRSPLLRAMALAPDDTQRYLWTDWAAVRRQLDVPARPAALPDLLEAGHAADLTSTSAMVDSAAGLAESLGVSPATASWELFAQADDGALVVVGLRSGDADRVTRALDRAGYERDGEIWDGAALQGALGIAPEFTYVAVEDDRLLAGDALAYLREALAEDGDPEEPVTDAADALGDPLSAVVYTGDHACSALALSGGDDTDQAQGEELVRQAGGVSPLASFAMGVVSTDDDPRVRVVLGFEDHDQAVGDADARATLASGPAPGQGGDFADRFELGEVRASGSVVTMELDPVEGAYVLSDLSSGPVLFASC